LSAPFSVCGSQEHAEQTARVNPSIRMRLHFRRY
jgi:hypothetical protein